MTVNCRCIKQYWVVSLSECVIVSFNINRMMKVFELKEAEISIIDEILVLNNAFVIRHFRSTSCLQPTPTAAKISYLVSV